MERSKSTLEEQQKEPEKEGVWAGGIMGVGGEERGIRKTEGEVKMERNGEEEVLRGG